MNLSEYLLQFFQYDHLPPNLANISVTFHDLAHEMMDKLPDDPQREQMLQKLIEAKDCAVRALVAGG